MTTAASSSLRQDTSVLARLFLSFSCLQVILTSSLVTQALKKVIVDERRSPGDVGLHHVLSFSLTIVTIKPRFHVNLYASRQDNGTSCFCGRALTATEPLFFFQQLWPACYRNFSRASFQPLSFLPQCRPQLHVLCLKSFILCWWFTMTFWYLRPLFCFWLLNLGTSVIFLL